MKLPIGTPFSIKYFTENLTDLRSKIFSVSDVLPLQANNLPFFIPSFPLFLFIFCLFTHLRVFIIYLFIFGGHYRALGRTINARYLKERLAQKDSKFSDTSRDIMEFFQQLDILTDTFYIEASLKDDSILIRGDSMLVRGDSILIRWPHVRESKTVFDCGSHAVDPGIQVLDSGFFVSETWILDFNR